MNKLIHERIIALMESEGISQADLSRMLKQKGNATVSRIVSGQVKPSFNVLMSIIELFPAVNLEWLIRGNGEMYIQPGKEEDCNETKDIKKKLDEFMEKTNNYFGVIQDQQKTIAKLIDSSSMFSPETKKKEL